MKTYCPALLMATVLWVAGLACSTVSGGAPIQRVTPDVTQQPAIPDTATPANTTPMPTEVTPKAPIFFTEEFNAGYAEQNWKLFTLGKGNPSKLIMEQRDDHLFFDLGDEDLYAYYMYTPYVYKNTSIKLNAQNLGRNNNNVSLICRMHDNGTKWYEFSVTSSGLWSLYAMDRIYNFMDGGGVNTLKQGTEENEYQMICNGPEITLLVNEEKIKTVKAAKYLFTEGYAGFSISSLQDYSVLPIRVEVNSFEIAQP